MPKQVFINGHYVDFDAAVNLMNDMLRDRLHSVVADFDDRDSRSYQNFANAYVEAHYAEFGEDFVVA